MVKSLMAGCACIVTLSGCAVGVPGLRPLTYQQPGETRVYVSHADCPNTPARRDQVAPFVGAIAMGVASKLLENFGSMLEKGAAGGALPSSVAMTNIELDADETPHCIIVIRGHFQPQKVSDPANDWSFVQRRVPDEAGNLHHISLKAGSLQPAPYDLPKVYGLQHYLELQFEASNNKSALTFAPVLTLVQQSMDGAKSGKRSVSVALSIQQPGSEAIGGAVLLDDLYVGQMRKAERLATGELPVQAPWFSAIQTKAANAPEADGVGGESGDGQAGDAAVEGGGGALPAAAGGERHAGGGDRGRSQTVALAAAGPAPAASADTPGDARRRTGIQTGGGSKTRVPGSGSPGAGGSGNPQTGAPDAEPDGPFPYTVTATVIETRPTKEFVAFVAGVFTTSAKPAIEAALQNRLDPTKVAAAEAGTIQAENTLEEKRGKARVAQADYCAMPPTATVSELLQKSLDLRIAQREANDAARAAKMKPLFLQPAVQSDQGPKEANPLYCP